MPTYTDLVIEGITCTISIPDYASRGIRVDVSPDPRSRQIAVDINGEAVDISLPKFRKRVVSISCSEMEKPTFEGVWPGDTVMLTLIPGLGFTSLMFEAMVGDWRASHEEWAARGDWTLELLEVRAPQFAS